MGINLLMEQKFKKILQKSKAWQEGGISLGKTFEGALFNQTPWPFLFSETEIFCGPYENKIYAPPPQKVQKVSDTLVVFIGDTYNPESGKEDLLGKMIGAMKLKPGEFQRITFDETLEDIVDLDQNSQYQNPATRSLYEKILDYRPEVIVSLGATVTNLILNKREKLSGIHGQFIEKTICLDDRSHSFSLVPLFHPDFLMINPNMKRTAWIDLQKVMERVGKI